MIWTQKDTLRLATVWLKRKTGVRPVHTCRKNRIFSPSTYVSEYVTKVKYRTKIILRL